MPPRSSNKQTVHIFSDGDPQNTVITNSDGTLITDSVTAFTVTGEARDRVRASLDLVGVNIDLDATVDNVYFLCPCCQEKVEHRCTTIANPDREVSFPF